MPSSGTGQSRWARRVGGEPELVKVRVVPSGEGVIDRHRKIRKRVGPRSAQDTAGSWPQALATPLDELHADREP